MKIQIRNQKTKYHKQKPKTQATNTIFQKPTVHKSKQYIDCNIQYRKSEAKIKSKIGRLKACKRANVKISDYK
jgi:hypothetical protein